MVQSVFWLRDAKSTNKRWMWYHLWIEMCLFKYFSKLSNLFFLKNTCEIDSKYFISLSQLYCFCYFITSLWHSTLNWSFSFKRSYIIAIFIVAENSSVAIFEVRKFTFQWKEFYLRQFYRWEWHEEFAKARSFAGHDAYPVLSYETV